MEEPRKTTRPAKPANESGSAKAVKPLTIFVDGEFVPEEDAKVSVFDHGLLYGDGIFEGIRFYNGGVFRLEATPGPAMGFGPLDLPGFTDVAQRDDGGSAGNDPQK